MSNLNFKWAALFFLLILLPTSILTYLSVNAFRDEQRSALSDLHLLVPQFQSILDHSIEDVAERIHTSPPGESFGQLVTDTPEIDLVFALDADGRFSNPRYLTFDPTDRSPTFQETLFRAENLEFKDRNYPAALQTYELASILARNDAEKAETLNALSRCSLEAGDIQTVQAVHEKLKAFPNTLDPDGAHPLTLSTLRLLRSLPTSLAAAVCREWADATLVGTYPLYPGCLQAVETIRFWLSENPDVDNSPILLESLDRIETQITLVENFQRLSKAGLGKKGQGYLSGTDTTGTSRLVHLHPLEDGVTIGILFDLEILSQNLARSPVGLDLLGKGFQISLFDVDFTSRFEDQNQEVIHLVSSASPSIYRMSLGMYSRDESSVLEYYRKRNLLVLAGIAILVSIIVLGVAMIFRDTVREVQMARLRSEFVSNVSHELRTPLTSIRLHAETLLMGRYRGQDQMQDYLNTVMQESHRLSRMVGNILDFSRMESGRKTYSFQQSDLGELVESTVSEFDPVLQEEGFSTDLEIKPHLPLVHIDREAIESAVANLISNAIKYSQDSKELQIAVLQQNGHQIVEIADRGIGVPSDEQNTIFTKFHRANNADTTATGTGLGLAIVKGIMDAHKGDVVVRDRNGGGSIFQLTLPSNSKA